MRQKKWSKTIYCIFTAANLANLSGCRDETSSERAANEKPNKNTRSNALPPFVLKEGSYLLSELSAPGQAQPQLEDFLLSSTGSDLAKEAGVDVKIDDAVIELFMNKDLALAFTNIGTRKPVSIKTQGHSLSLIGRVLKNLKVETKVAGKKAGDVNVYALEEVSGDFDLGGADGEGGADGLCPPGFEDCARVPGQAFPMTTLQPQIERRQEEQVVQDVGTYANRLAFAEFQIPPPPSDPLGHCVPFSSSPFSKEITERFDGQLILRRRVPVVSWQGPVRGQDGWLSPGTPGGQGQDAGKLTVTTPPEAVLSIAHDGSGGKGGATGRHGIVQAAPQPAATHFAADTQVELDAFNVSKVFNYKIYWSMSAANPCGRGGCPGCPPRSKVGEKKQPATNPYLTWSEPNDFAPPQTFPGNSPTLVEPEPAQAGNDGIFEQTKNPDLQTISIGELDIPLFNLIRYK